MEACQSKSVSENTESVEKPSAPVAPKKVYKPWQFQPGHPPMGGRPKGSTTLAGLLKILADEIDPASGESNEKMIAKALCKKAKEGDARSIEIYRDTKDGKPIERMRVSKGPDESHITDEELNEGLHQLANGGAEGASETSTSPEALPPPA